MSSPIRKGNVLRPSAIETWVMKGMVETNSLRRDQVKFNASGSYCPRQAVKHFHTTRKGTITPASRAYMTLGISIHDMVTDALYKTNRLIFKEFKLPLREKPDIRGVVDAIYFGADDKINGMEVKSCGNLPRRPREEAEQQALIYSALTGLDFTILYLSRKVAGWDQKLMVKSFDVECSEEAMHNALTKVCIGYFAEAKGVLPEIPPTFKKDTHCRFCPFADECWDGEEEDKPTADTALMGQIWDKAEQRAGEILLEREDARSGILKHIQRHAPATVQKKLAKMVWS